jgi:hypothetical protein
MMLEPCGDTSSQTVVALTGKISHWSLFGSVSAPISIFHIDCRQAQAPIKH